jgi:L-lysine exporter family protein LysE/ArgO
VYLAATTGFISAFSLILAIGAQNAFVLRQGLKQRHVFWLCLLCAASDAVLIVAGVAGFGKVVLFYPVLPKIMAIAGSAFLFVYGAFRFRAARLGSHGLDPSGNSVGLWATLGTGLALTWLNPHVYLDTLGLIGAISTQFSETGDRAAFAAGATVSSFVFFFSLGYGARLLAPIMGSVQAWQVLDFLIGATMWGLAVGLLATIV